MRALWTQPRAVRGITGRSTGTYRDREGYEPLAETELLLVDGEAYAVKRLRSRKGELALGDDSVEVVIGKEADLCNQEENDDESF